jgi:acyl-CoA reductase-like NAD-dependent aldehyde dehydrogenase
MNGKVLPISGDFFSYTRREPVGIVGQIIPVGTCLHGDVNAIRFSLASGTFR